MHRPTCIILVCGQLWSKKTRTRKRWIHRKDIQCLFKKYVYPLPGFSWLLDVTVYMRRPEVKAHPILILKCGQNICDLSLVQYQEVYLWFLNNKLFSVTESKFANLRDFVAEISIAKNIYHCTSTDLANLNLGNLNLGDVHIFCTGSLWKSHIHWSTPRRRRIKK
jgi:hypothetical protein